MSDHQAIARLNNMTDEEYLKNVIASSLSLGIETLEDNENNMLRMENNGYELIIREIKDK